MRLSLLTSLFTVGCGPVLAGWTTQIYGPHVMVATGETDQVTESSGVVASRVSADIFWTHNDSGAAAPKVWAFRLSMADVGTGIARHMGYVELVGASNGDWEDIAAGPGGTIYVFDGGDNPPCNRTNKRIHRFVEPVVDPDGAPISVTLTTYDSIRFEYPDTSDPAQPADSDDERYDAECLFVHPASGDVYLVTKRSNGNVATARVYKLPASSIGWSSGVIHVLEFVADISTTIPSMSTGGDLDAAGQRVVVRDYATAYEFTLPEGEPFDAVFGQSPRTVGLLGELQGEGICYAPDGGNLITTSEVLSWIGPTTFPVFVTPWELANVRAEPVYMHAATILWDTAEPLGSQVDYGLTTGYGETESDSTPVTGHEVALTNLSSGQRYFYRVASDSLVYPSPGEANEVFFDSPTTVQPDFDADGDVDQDDFGHLQTCFTGAGVPQESTVCQDARLDADSDVDGGDFTLFRDCMSGAGMPAAADCLE